MHPELKEAYDNYMLAKAYNETFPTLAFLVGEDEREEVEASKAHDDMEQAATHFINTYRKFNPHLVY